MTWQEWVRSGLWERDIDGAMPMLPTAANEVVRLAADPDVSASRITVLVSKDPVLVVRVIRLANSAFSAPAIEIASLGEAVLRGGTRAVRNAVLAECMTARMLDPRIYGAHSRALGDHAIGTACLAWRLAEHVKEPPDESFLHGLLHDIGKLLILKLAYDFARKTGKAVDETAVAEFVIERHADLGGRLLRKWQLPVSLEEPVVHHHDPARANGFWRAASITYAANRLAHRYGFGCPAVVEEPAALLDDPVFQALRLDDAFLARTDAEAPRLFEIARQFTN